MTQQQNPSNPGTDLTTPTPPSTPSTSTTPDPSAAPEPASIWQRTWFQRLVVALVVLALAAMILPPVVALMYAVRPVLLPVLVGIALAYAVNPLAGWLQRRARVPRPVTAVTLMGGLAVAVLAFSILVVPRLVRQMVDLIYQLPGYVEGMAERFELDLVALRQQAEDAARSLLVGDRAADAELDFEVIGEAVWRGLDLGIGGIGTTLGWITYLLLAAVIIAFVFFFFLWRFEHIKAWFLPLIPAAHRERSLAVAGMMDRSVSSFIRGRIIQAIIVAIVLSVGWASVGVPYWLVLGLLGGLLNLIPYAVVVTWPLAVLFAWLDVLTGDSSFSFWWIIFWPSAVYLVAQALDAWVVEPLVQGRATDLDPLTVLLAVLVGGTLAGLFGMLIAIPLAACLKILARELLLPPLRAWAAGAGGT